MTTTIEQRVKITRHQVPDSSICDLGPDMFCMDEVVTAECGEVTGAIVRTVDYDLGEDTREVTYEVRIDGSDETAGLCSWCSCTPSHFSALSLVAQALAAEWEALQ